MHICPLDCVVMQCFMLLLFAFGIFLFFLTRKVSKGEKEDQKKQNKTAFPETFDFAVVFILDMMRCALANRTAS